MLVNPCSQFQVLPGTRLLTETFGLVGAEIEDPHQDERVWRVTSLFSPLPRALGGIRAKLVDNKDFLSFINQRDLELLLGVAQPGDWCPWLGQYYPGLVEEEGWYGPCCDDDDLLDALQEKELYLRQEFGGVIPDGVEYIRKVHKERGNDYEELLLFLWDKDPETNYGPDGRLETIERRWVRVERRRVEWSRVSV